MIERNGDMFTTTAKMLGHGVNCKGVMGAGVAKTMREKFPYNYNEYRLLCNKGQLVPGDTIMRHDSGKAIVNMATQNQPGPDARYDWVFLALYRTSFYASRPKTLETLGNNIAIPEIGCGIGGLHWSLVKPIIETVEQIFPKIEYEVWHYV